MRARILAIGDELLIGQVVNSNAAWLGDRLTALGIAVDRSIVVPDDRAVIAAELERALESSDLVVVTGGLGPTHDDLTRVAVCDTYGVEARVDAAELERVRARFERRGLTMPERNVSQAEVPETFRVLSNPVGTAPGLVHDGLPERGWGRVVVLPGIPHEMKTLMDTYVLPMLASVAGRGVIVQKTLLTTGAGESNLQELIGPIDDLLGPTLGLAYLPSVHGVRLRITGRGGDREQAERAVDRMERRLRERIGRYVWGEGDQTLESVVGGLLLEGGRTVATAESCTGGLIASRLTDVPGASRYVMGGVVAYDNAVKTGSLGVDAGQLAEHGAVSRPVAEAMADGVRRVLGADLGIGVTGILGPDGGTPDKPVGTVWIAVADASRTHAVRLRLGHDRLRNKEQTATAALDLLRLRLTRPDADVS